MAVLKKAENNIGRKTVLKAGIVACVVFSLSSLSSISYGQIPDEAVRNTDAPLRATATTTPAEQETLPKDLQPENLLAPRVRNIDPERVKRLRAESRNSWNPAILTQSTGLSAASLQASARQKRQDTNREKQIFPAALEGLSPPSLLGSGNPQLSAVKTVSVAPPRQEGMFELGTSIRGALFDVPTSESVNASMLNLGSSERLCLGTTAECQINASPQLDLGFAKNITRGKANGLNLQLTPRAGIRFDEDSKSALVGALVRIGDNLRDGAGSKPNTWYFFAGADAEAISYAPNSIRSLNSGGFHLQERILVGDAQAGLGYRIGAADFAFTYFKRQASADNFSFNEDAAAFSITLKR